MKKLMIVCAAVVMTAAVQAASVSWAIGNVYSPSDSTAKVAAGSMSAYLFVTANTTDKTTGIPVTTLAAVQAALDSGDIAGLSSLSAAHGVNSASGAFTGATGLEGFSSGTLSAFAVVFDNADAASAENYFLVNGGATKDVTFTSATGIKTFAFGSQTSYTQGAGKWSAVPEPTSGLLLLLGMAGLALKRKVA